MPTVSDLMTALGEIAPPTMAFEWDRIGLQVGSLSHPVSRVAVSLDSGLSALRWAAGQDCQALVAHHPIVWDPMKTVTDADATGARVIEAARLGLAVVAAHTNWDCAPGGVNDTLASALGLFGVAPFGSTPEARRFKLVTFVPRGSEATVLDAVSGAGAGRIGEYSRCAFWSEGTGTFVGGPGTNPIVGRPGQVESVDEIRLETVVGAADLRAVIAALRESHPYEEPAFDVFPLAPAGDLPIGRYGRLPAPMRLSEFVAHVDGVLATRSMAWGGGRAVERVAVVGGSAADEWRAAAAVADVLVTGEVPHHVSVEAAEEGFALLAAGHYATEQPGAAALAERLAQALPGIQFALHTPEPGAGGRPC